MNLFLDIETLPTDRADVRAYLAASVKHPATISKAETIAKWNEESRPGAVDEAVAKTGLDGSFGRVCVIGWALDDDDVKTVYNATDERILLQAFSDRLRINPSDQFATTVVGHNVSGFDLRFLVQRYIVHKMRPPAVIARAAQAKPWEAEKVFCTMTQWAGVGNRVSLEKLCLALSIPSPKSDITGATVAAAVAAGRIDDVAAYCVGDVQATRAVHRRMTFAA
jgi:hypothetical protein